MSKLGIHASYDTLTHILNLAGQILPRPLWRDVLDVHKKAFHFWSFLTNGILAHMGWTLEVALGRNFKLLCSIKSTYILSFSNHLLS